MGPLQDILETWARFLYEENATLAFLRRKRWLILAVSAAVLIPCFWHRRIEAGDLGSHVYNAWLAQLIEKGQAPGLYIAKRWNNISGAENRGLYMRADFFWGSIRICWCSHGAAAVAPHAVHRHAGLRLFVQHGFHELLFVARAGLFRAGHYLARAKSGLDWWHDFRAAGFAGASHWISVASRRAGVRQDQNKIAGMVEAGTAAGSRSGNLCGFLVRSAPARAFGGLGSRAVLFV